MMRTRNPVAYRLAAIAGLAFGLCGLARAEPAAYAPPAQMAGGQSPKPSAAHASQAPTTPPAPTTAPSLLDHPAQPAKITLDAGKLTIQADNSILADILHEVAKESGMKIDGLDAGPAANRRVFGSYGPGAPRDVLSDLLSDSGYNFLMLGDTSSGTPRELALTVTKGGANSAPPNQAANASQEQDNPDEPQNSPEPLPGPPGIQNRVRTPQQMLQELQRMREQQQQQQQDQQQDQPDQPDQDQAPDQPN